MAVHQKDLDVLEEQLGALNAQLAEKQAALSRVDGPIKKLLDEKYAL